MNKNFDSQWFTYNAPNSTMVGKFKIRPFNNEGYKNAMAALDCARDRIDDDEYIRQTAEIVSCHLIADWDEIDFIKDGVITPTPYNVRNAVDLFLTSNLGIEILKWIMLSSISLCINSQLMEGNA